MKSMPFYAIFDVLLCFYAVTSAKLIWFSFINKLQVANAGAYCQTGFQPSELGLLSMAYLRGTKPIGISIMLRFYPSENRTEVLSAVHVHIWDEE